MSRALGVLTHLAGVAAFTVPLFISSGSRAPHATDAPWLFTLLGAAVIGLALARMRDGSMDARRVAMLGVLAAINAVLRVPGSFGGASLMFVLPILVGFVFGPRDGFLLGATSMAASTVITGGIGPWLPFQMWALGWVGAGAGLLPGRGRALSRVGVGVLALYGWVTGFAFGVVMNLWSWPFVSGDGPLAFQAGLPVTTVLTRYVRFYLATSLAWDGGRALVNAVLLTTLAVPAVRSLRRARARITTEWVGAAVRAPG